MVASQPALDSGTSRAATRFAGAVVRFRWVVLLASLAAVLALAAGARHLVIDAEYRIWFDEDSPELRAFEALQNVYTRNDSILFVVTPRDGPLFSPRPLAAVEALTGEAWSLPFSKRVDSVTNFQHTRADEDELIVADLLENAESLDTESLARAREAALAEPALRGRLVAVDGRVAGVNVVFAFPGEAGTERPEAAAAARALRDRIEAAYPEVEVRLTGLAMLDVAFFEAGQRDGATLTPLMLGVVIVALGLLLRSIYAALSALLVIVLSAAAALGAGGWLGIALNPATSIAPTIVMTLAVADCVHVMSSFLRERRAGRERRDAATAGLAANLHPVALTSLTTAAGFLTLNFSDAPPFRDLGNLAAIGVLVAMGLSLTLLPALAAILPSRPPRAVAAPSEAMARFADAIVRRAAPLRWGIGLVAVLLTLGAIRIEFDDDFVRYFDAAVPFRADTDYAAANLTGIDTLEFDVRAEGPGGIAEPAYLDGLDRLAVWLRDQPEVAHVSTLTDTLRRINRSLHGDVPDRYRIPGTREEAAQYLLLYELSLPFGLDLNDRINLDKSATRLIVTMTRISQRELLAAAARIEAWMGRNLPPAMHARAAGPSIMFARISERNVRSMLTGTVLALVLVSVLLAAAFASLRLGLVSLVPNLVPIAMAFGAWGLLMQQVNVAVSVVAAVSLGIVVDDTIHFLARYRRARLKLDPADSVRRAFAEVGPALAKTTTVLVASFLLLATSPFAVNAQMALLTAVAMVFALAVDFLLLPPLLLATDRGRHAQA